MREASADDLRTLIEIAAIALTPSNGATFTKDQLLHEVKQFGGSELESSTDRWLEAITKAEGLVLRRKFVGDQLVYTLIV